MKHIFRISSHLTFFLSKKIIESKGIDHNDCVLFLVRDYSVPNKYKDMFPHVIHTSYNVSQTKGRVFAGLNFFKTRRNIAEFDGLVDPYIQNEDFYWYAQICNDDFCSLMVSKPNCKGYYVIEDGLGSYVPQNPQSFVGAQYWLFKLVLKPLFPRIFMVKNFYVYTDHPKFKGCIASSKDCFPLHQQYLEVVGNPFEKETLAEPIEAILSVDPLYRVVGIDVVEKTYTDLAKFIATKGYKTLHCKYHPWLNAESNKEIRKQYEAILSKCFGDNLKELPSDCVLENVISSCQCDFYTNHSSVAIYAHNAGAKCYCMSPIIQKYYPAYKENELVERTVDRYLENINV